ncbi:MAG: tripartite tricarboxylate transporter substrate binding protein [Betaproteobacteria bacterium]|nr:tripartite tricarboxylate transporter substrate binding protein [Betaproteobacteria bacterium]
MKTKTAGMLTLSGALLFAAVAAPLAQAQDAWPSKPLRFIIPSTPGSASDFAGRTFARFIEPRLKQPVVSENRPGAAAIIGTEALKNSPADGYTYLIGGSSVTGANPVLFRKLPYDAEKDLEEVGIFGFFPIIGMVKKDSPIKSVADIIAMARANPGKVSFGYYSPLAQVSPEIIKSRTGIELIAVSYKLVSQISTDIAGGVVDFTFLDAIGAAPVIKSGLLRPIAVTSPRRVPSMPDVPTVAELLAGFEVQGWSGLTTNKGSPMAAVERMNGLLRAMQTDPEFKELLERQGMVVTPTPSVAEHAKFAAAERVRWAEWVKLAKIPQQ